MNLSDVELRIISMGYADLPRITTPQARSTYSICLGGGKGTRLNHFCPQFDHMAGLAGLVVIVSCERVTCWEGLAIILSWKGESRFEWRAGRSGVHLRIATTREDLIGSVSDRFGYLIGSVSDRFSI